MFEQTSKFGLVGGYSKVYLVANRLFNILLALLFLGLAAPLLLVVAVVIKLQSGSPVLYKGERLGLHKKPFTMYKFRTLVPEAEAIVGPETLTPRHGLVTPVGRFLRDTRIDELPQLFNILKGDMDFVGPRPERPIIYEKICKQIKGYERRFEVKPGLIGYSQLFTPHSSPKALRTLIDNCFLRRKQKFAWDFLIVLYTIVLIVKGVLVKGTRGFWHNLVRKRLLGLYQEKRTFERYRQDAEATVYIGTKVEDREVFGLKARLVDINEEAFLIYTNRKIEAPAVTMELHKALLVKMRTSFTPPLKKTFFSGMRQTIWPTTARKRQRKTKIARCAGTIYREVELRDGPYRYSYVIKYQPLSPFNHYLVHQYFMGESVASK